MSRSSNRPAAAVLLVLVAFSARATDAGDIQSWTLAGGPNATGNVGTHGTEFTPNVPITVTRLGVYDDTLSTADGLSASHPVGIFDAQSQALLISAIIPSGTLAPRVGDFRFIQVEPTTLAAGHAYIVATLQTGDPGRVVTPGSSMLPDSGLTLGPWRTGPQTFGFPTSALGVSTRFMGAAFCYDPTPPAPPPGAPAWTITLSSSANTNSGMSGTEFTPTVDIDVTALGVYDDTFITGDGLENAHPVGIFEAVSQQLIVSTTVPAGTATPLFGRFRYQSITPARLSAGTAYVVAALVTNAPGVNVTPGSSMTVDPRMTLGPRRSGGSNFSFPGSVNTAMTRYMGADFVFTLPASFPRGDVDCDNAVNFFDVDPFLLALFDPVAYELQYPDCDLTQADINADDLVNFFDVDPFVACLFGTCP